MIYLYYFLLINRREEMPPALKRVQEACDSLQQAAKSLRLDPSSAHGKRQLIAGERGILQGVSAILLTFDESEVRKIVRTCRQVLEYLSITELIEKMDDLVTYVKVFLDFKYSSRFFFFKN